MFCPVFVLALSFVSVLTQNPNCDFRQEVAVGQTYYVYSPGYPNNYTSGIQCRWLAQCPAGYNCRLDCTEINLPYTSNCEQDRLLISKTGDPQLSQAERYCGLGALTAVSRAQTMSVGLIVSSNSRGGRFICRLTAELSTPPVDSCRCGYKKSNRIVGGEETGINEFPMMVGLADRNFYRIKCGGVIISPRGVLTAAHCLTFRAPNDVAVIVGEHDVTAGDSPATQGYQAISFLIHPRWNSNTYDYDVGIVTVGQDMKFSDRVGPVCLPFKFTSDDFAGKTVTALGWGTTSLGGPDSDVLLKVNLPVITQQACQAKNPLFLSNRQMCTFTRGKDSCQDDSGGPLLYTDSATGFLFSVGIISAGTDCGNQKYAGVNTRVTAMLDWIVQNHPYNYCKK